VAAHLEPRLSCGDYLLRDLDRLACCVDGSLFMSALDFVVLIGSMISIAAYGVWHTRGNRGLKTYLKGDSKTAWFAIGLSVMATQASAIFHTSHWRFGRFLVGASIAGTRLLPLLHSPYFLPLVPAYRLGSVRDTKHLSTELFQSRC
jgi:hypothetical protein